MLKGTLRHERSLVKTAEYEFQFSRIRIDITNGVDTRYVSGIVECIDFNCVLINI